MSKNRKTGWNWLPKQTTGYLPKSITCQACKGDGCDECDFDGGFMKCESCEVELPIQQFNPNTKGDEGHAARCPECKAKVKFRTVKQESPK